MTAVVHTRADLDAVRPDAPVAVVMTMGALHSGHLALVERARELVASDGSVVVTVFVNPLQFGAGEDFERYPRTLDDDVAACRSVGVDVVFAPDVDEVYRGGGGTAIDPGPRGDILEGAARPGHFRGVLTVVGKLLHIVRPDAAVFGEKDYQQLTLIRSMVEDLDWQVRVDGVPTVREADGLAMSSRNRYLSADERRRAAAIPAALMRATRRPWPTAAACRGDVHAELVAAGLVPDYVEVTAPDLTGPGREGPARLLVAVRVGQTRLIDNVPVDLLPGSADTDSGTIP